METARRESRRRTDSDNRPYSQAKAAQRTEAKNIVERDAEREVQMETGKTAARLERDAEKRDLPQTKAERRARVETDEAQGRMEADVEMISGNAHNTQKFMDEIYSRRDYPTSELKKMKQGF